MILLLLLLHILVLNFSTNFKSFSLMEMQPFKASYEVSRGLASLSFFWDMKGKIYRLAGKDYFDL